MDFDRSSGPLLAGTRDARPSIAAEVLAGMAAFNAIVRLAAEQGVAVELKLAPITARIDGIPVPTLQVDIVVPV